MLTGVKDLYPIWGDSNVELSSKHDILEQSKKAHQKIAKKLALKPYRFLQHEASFLGKGWSVKMIHLVTDLISPSNEHSFLQRRYIFHDWGW